MGVSEFLNNRRIFESEFMLEEKYEMETKAMVDDLVDRLVLVMKIADANGLMELDKIERMVVKAFRAAEYKYYGLTKDQLRIVVEMEKRNAQGRKRNK